MIKLDNVTKAFETAAGTTLAADQVSFEVKEGEICVLLGPSGCGKTTTLKMVNRLIPFDPASQPRRRSSDSRPRVRSTPTSLVACSASNSRRLRAAWPRASMISELSTYRSVQGAFTTPDSVKGDS